MAGARRQALADWLARIRSLTAVCSLTIAVFTPLCFSYLILVYFKFVDGGADEFYEKPVDHYYWPVVQRMSSVRKDMHNQGTVAFERFLFVSI